jgi:signal transduction histidine kinase/CHASE2 domain-containing sensor protein
VALVTWFAPSLSAASTNALFRLRGELTPSEEIVIVAVDDRSLQKIGTWPWRRSVMANLVDKISEAQPRAVGLDVLYAEASDDDARLAEALKRNDKVVLPAQLVTTGEIDITQGQITWLRPVIGEVAGVGHAHVSPDVDGILRAIQLSKADDEGTRLWAFSLEVVRQAEAISANDFAETPQMLRFGPYQIHLREQESIASEHLGVKLNRPNEMLINYVGPAGSFPRYSLVDVIEGAVPVHTFTNKIVLIGAVATSMSDVGVSPFMGYSSNEKYAGQEMPGVEVHANIINTIRQRIWLRTLPEFLSFLVALIVVASATLVVNKLDTWRQIAGLGLILLTIVLGSFVAFKHFLLIPPLPALLVAFAASIPLLLNRTLNASRRLDLKLAALAHTQQGFLLPERNGSSSTGNSSAWLDLPHNLAGKLRAVDDITTRLLARMNFMDRVLAGMGEGVLVADASGRVVFANPEAAQVFGASPEQLLNENFAEAFIARGVFVEAEWQRALQETSSGKISQKEFMIQSPSGRAHYSLQLSGIVAREGADASTWSGEERMPLRVIGLVALIADTTRRVELDQIRIESLQLVSHELRTPLTSIQGLSDVLLKFPVETSQAQEMLATIHGEALRLSETINRYLDLARLESGAQSLRVTTVDLEQLVAACTRTHAPLAKDRRIEITGKFSQPHPRLEGDAQLLGQALNNLLSNAIKYSPVGSEVKIEIDVEEKTLLIVVRDRGEGIPPEECERLFEKFYRLERDAAAGIVGTGLGLPLVKEIAERHGGRILVESTPGSGSAFKLELPLKQPSTCDTASKEK